MRGLSRSLVEKYNAVTMSPADAGRGFAKDFGKLAQAHGANMAHDPAAQMVASMEADGPAADGLA